MSKQVLSGDPYLVESVARACDLLRAFRGESEQLPLRELSARTGLTASRAFRLLHTLERAGFVEKADSARYRTRARLLDKPAYRIGYAGQTTESAFARDVADSLRAAAERRRFRLVEVNNRSSASAALRNAEALIAAKVELAIEFQTYARVAPQIASRFREAKIPLIAVDIAHPGATYFGADNYQAGLIGGRAAAEWTRRHWGGRIDTLVLLEIRAAGPMPDARLEGILAGVRETIAIPDTAVLRPDSGGDARGGHAAAVRALRRPGNILFGAGNDPAALGAVQAIEEAGAAGRAAIVSQGATAEGRAEMRRPGSPLIGAVAYFPERYGERLCELAETMLEGRSTPPAVFVRHEMISPDNVDRFYPNETAIAEPAAVMA